LRRELKRAVVDEYAALTAEAKTAGDDGRTVQRLRRTLRDIERRDYVSPKERDDARRAVQRLVDWSGVAESAL
jgi:hypothetical protein